MARLGPQCGSHCLHVHGVSFPSASALAWSTLELSLVPLERIHTETTIVVRKVIWLGVGVGRLEVFTGYSELRDSLEDHHRYTNDDLGWGGLGVGTGY